MTAEETDSTGPTGEPSPRYERRALIYFDILGWKELIRRSATEPRLHSKIEAALTLFEATKPVFSIAGPGPQFRLSNFSDHFVVSAPLSFSGTFGFLAAATKNTVVQLMALQQLCVRGAIVVGDLVHETDRIYGPALLEAHDIESRVARYPRIVLSEEAIELASREDNRTNVPLRVDADGLTFFDLLAPTGTLGNPPGSPVHELLRDRFAKYREALRHPLAKDMEVRAKLGWLLNYLETAASEAERAAPTVA
jgi:hypothetical protein